MKTTVDLPDELLIAAKKRAAETRTSLKVILSRGLRRELAAPARPRRKRGPLRLPTVPGGLPPGLDLESRAAMHEFFRHTR